MNINGRTIGQGSPCYIIAEMSANHGGSLDKALSLVRAAKESGADAIKLQTYTPDTMTINCDNDYFRLGDHPLWGKRTLYELYGQAATPWEWHKPLKAEADRVGIEFFSTPFDESAVDFLEGLGVRAYKIASFELVDDLLLRKVAATGKPVIMSTGMAKLEEIGHAVGVLREHGNKELALLRCVSSYPARPEEMKLPLMADLRERFGVVSGFSDHSIDHTTVIAAVALGASIIEKHFKLSDADDTVDAAFSLSQDKFSEMVRYVRAAEAALCPGAYGPTRDEGASLRFRRSIFVVEDMKAGDVFTRRNLRVIRPGYGLAPVAFEGVLGRKAVVAIARGTPLKQEWIGAVDGQ